MRERAGTKWTLGTLLLVGTMGCGGPGRDPVAAAVSVSDFDDAFQVQGCAEGATWLAGSSLTGNVQFTRSCHGFFGFGDSCGPLTGVGLSVVSGEGWSTGALTYPAQGNADFASVVLEAPGTAQTTLTASANGQSFPPLALRSAVATSLALRRESPSKGRPVGGATFELVTDPGIVVLDGADAQGKLLTSATSVVLWSRSKTAANASVRVKVVGSPAPEQTVTAVAQ